MENFRNRKQHGMLFNTAMVQALLAGRKTVTRRLVKSAVTKFYEGVEGGEQQRVQLLLAESKVKVGDLIYVKETFTEYEGNIIYKADYLDNGATKWKSSLFMPKAYSRIWLEVTEVRVEKLQAITEEEAIAEGVLRFEYVEPVGFYANYSTKELTYQQFLESQFATAKESYKSLWESINGINSWDENPYVYVISFKKIDNPLTTL